MTDRFNPRAHVPQFSRMLWETLRVPVVVYMFLVGNIVFFAGSVGFYMVESGINPGVNSVLDAFWWGMATVTTVGFGDIVPTTNLGRLIGFVMIATGVLLFVGANAIFSSAFFARTRSEIIDLEEESKSEWEQVLGEITALREEVRALRGTSSGATPRVGPSDR